MKRESKGAKDPKAAKGRPVVAALALAVGLVAAGSWWLFRPAPVRVGDVDLGALPPGTEPSDLNLLVITLDTTRADRIGAYGEMSGATPTIDRLAREGVVFENAV